MSTRIPPEMLDPQGIPDGKYAINVVGGVVTGLEKLQTDTSNKVLLLDVGAPVPAGTVVGTIIMRKA